MTSRAISDLILIRIYNLSNGLFRWVLLIRFVRFLSYFCLQVASLRGSVAGYMTDETCKMKQKEPERRQKVKDSLFNQQNRGN